MSKMYHRPLGPNPGGRKLFLATPTYGGTEPIFTYALAETTAALVRAGIDYELAIYAGDCHVDDARNRLVRQFLMGSCTDLIFLDSDLRWQPEDFIKLAGYDRDVVAGTYPLKQTEENFPVRFLTEGEPINLEPDGLIEVDGVPTGFLRIRRQVLEQLAANAPKYYGRADAGQAPTPLIFERTLEDGRRFGGDYTFCRKWRAMGGKIYVTPELVMEHAGTKIYQGSLGFFLRAQGDAIGECLKAIREGRENNYVYDRMIQEWGNPWGADRGLLAASVMLAREAKTILECGSGLTTLAMAAANPDADIVALESDGAWYSRVTNAAKRYDLPHLTLFVPLKDGWYDNEVLGRKYDLAIIDGPSRALGSRERAHEINAKTFLFDDVAHGSPKLALAALKTKGYGITKLDERCAVAHRAS
jgi:hypothetical protein